MEDEFIDIDGRDCRLEPTNGLRILMRDGSRIFQQQWRAERTEWQDGKEMVIERTVWRDVPLVSPAFVAKPTNSPEVREEMLRKIMAWDVNYDSADDLLDTLLELLFEPKAP